MPQKTGNAKSSQEVASLAARALDQGKGILRLAPTWVPRSFCVPGRRIKLHPNDYYAYGGERGGIDERWFASTTPADNGPLTSENEGLSPVVDDDNGTIERVLLRDAVLELKGELIGERIWDDYGRWPMYSKFFDNKGALPHHVHHRDEHAALTGQMGKPEAYYFPPQVNNHGGDFPYTFFGLEPGTTREEVRECLVNFTKGDNRLTNLSRAYRLQPGTGWNVPPGVLHAPGSLCTYEPQKASDVFAMYQSLTGDQVIPEELLWKDTPAEKVGDVDHLLAVLDWEKNVDPHFAETNFMAPRPVRPVAEMEAEGYVEHWIAYRSDAFSAKELTVLPGRTVTIRDGGAYGMIMMQGHGTMGVWPIETPALIRFGQLTHDEYFVSDPAARDGVTIVNLSATDPIVMLKHFGPGNLEMPG
ncbi:MAG: class I mannose-6-phosphate isomerase [Planctomycetota bacterium]